MSRIISLHIQDSLKFNYYLLGVCFRANTRLTPAWGPHSSPASSSPPSGAWWASSYPSWCLGAHTRASSRLSWCWQQPVVGCSGSVVTWVRWTLSLDQYLRRRPCLRWKGSGMVSMSRDWCEEEISIFVIIFIHHHCQNVCTCECCSSYFIALIAP